MNSKKLFFHFTAIFLLPLLFGCASSYCTHYLDTVGKIVEYRDGTGYQISRGINSTVSMGLAKGNGNLEIILGITNTGDKSLFVNSSIVKATYQYYNQNYSLKIYSDVEWINKLQNAQMAAAVVQGISQGLESVNAGKSTTNITASAYGSNGSYAYGSGTASTYDYASAAAVRRQHDIERNQLAQGFQAQMQNARSSLIRANTIYPGQSISGVVMAQYQSADRLDFIVNCGEDIHRFSFKITGGVCQEEKPDPLDARVNNIYSYFNQKQYQQAVNEFTAILNQYPTNFYSLKGRALAFVFLENRNDAFQDYSRCIEIVPNDGDSYNRRGWISLKLKNYHDAIADFSKAIKLLPDSMLISPYAGRARALLEVKDYQGAYADYQYAISIKPLDPYLCNSIGWVALWLGRGDEAKNAFEKGIELDRSAPAPYFNLCDYYWTFKKDKESVLKYLEKGALLTNGEEYYFKALYNENEDGHFLQGINETEEFKTIINKYKKTQ
jgi:tetratricopeptide (TPR) repeat protein